MPSSVVQSYAKQTGKSIGAVENIEIAFDEGSAGGDEVDVFENAVLSPELHIRQEAAHRNQLFEEGTV